MLFQDYGGHTAAAATAAGDQTELNIFLSVINIIIITDVSCDYIRIHIGKRFTISVDIAAHITTNTANIAGIINTDIVTINTDIPDVIDVVTVTDKAVDSIGIGTDITTTINNITISTNMFVGMIMRVTAMAMIMTDNEVSIAVNTVDNATIVTVVVTVVTVAVQCSIWDDDSLI